MTEASSPVEQAPFAFNEVLAEVVASGKWDLQKAGNEDFLWNLALKVQESQGFWMVDIIWYYITAYDGYDGLFDTKEDLTHTQMDIAWNWKESQ